MSFPVICYSRATLDAQKIISFNTAARQVEAVGYPAASEEADPQREKWVLLREAVRDPLQGSSLEKS